MLTKYDDKHEKQFTSHPTNSNIPINNSVNKKYFSMQRGIPSKYGMV